MNATGKIIILPNKETQVIIARELGLFSTESNL